MRVGLFTESYDPIINGVSTSVKTLAAELSARRHTPVIVAPRYAGFADDGGDGGAPVLRVPSLRTVFAPTYPIVLPPLGPPPASLRGARFDVVHTQQPFGLGMHGRRCARGLGVPLVSTNHTLYNEYTHYVPLLPTRTKQAVVSAVMRRYYNGCDAVVVPSRAAGEILEAMGVRAPLLRVVPTGVPEAPAVVPAAVEQARRTFALPPGAPVLLYVGRLAREKNLEFLVDAFARLCALRAHEGDQRPVLLLVGSGPYAAACRQRVRQAGIEPFVRFAGFLKRTQLAPIYAASTLFVFASTTETQGVVLSEAQSFGLPCVVVRGGGAAEFVRDGTDALVTPADQEAFCSAILALLADGERRRAMSAAALLSPLHPTPGEMARRLLEIYEEAREIRRTNLAS